jgi:threonine aldolase
MAQMAAFSGVLARPIAGRDGIPSADGVRRALRSPVYYVAQTGLVALENTHNMAGGTILPPDVAEAIAAVARAAKLPLHLDGARIFNAAVASSRPAAELARPFDSVMFCLSKGLGAPIGSILAGPASFIEEALRVRKRLGGGMRQAGILAAAGLVALDHQVARLAEDHAMARRLADRVAALPQCGVDAGKVETNILIFSVAGASMPAPRLVERWKEAGVLALALDDTRIRVVTHYDVTPADIEVAADRLVGVLA